MQLPYSSKATAVRGAKRSGIENPVIELRDGKWYIVETATPAEPVNVGPALSPETTAKAEAVIENAKLDLEKLAAVLPPRVTSTPEEIAARRAERAAKLDATKAEAASKPKVPTYKEMLRVAPQKSTATKPVDVIRAYLDANYGSKPRKTCIAELVAMGINMTTCRTQYQIYRKKLGA